MKRSWWSWILLALMLWLLASPSTAQVSCAVYKTYALREVVTNTDLNASFTRTVDQNIPQCVDDYSSTVTQMRSTVDPYPSDTESLATTLAGELERLRYQLNAIIGKTYWYQDADNSLAKSVSKHWGLTFTKFSEIGDPASPGSNELALYAKDDGAGVTVLAYKDSAGTVNTLTGPSTSYGSAVTVNLTIKRNSGTPNTHLDVTADRISVAGFIKASLSVTIDTTTTGANALDTGTRTLSTFYYVWAIYNPASATFAGLASLSETAPTMPSGYTQKRLLGGFRTDASNNFIPGTQYDNIFTYMASYPAVISAGTATTATSFSVSGFAPATTLRAVHLSGEFGASNSLYLHHDTFTVAAGNVQSQGGGQGSLNHVGLHRLQAMNATRSTFYYAVSAGTLNLRVTGWEIQWKD